MADRGKHAGALIKQCVNPLAHAIQGARDLHNFLRAAFRDDLVTVSHPADSAGHRGECRKWGEYRSGGIERQTDKNDSDCRKSIEQGKQDKSRKSSTRFWRPRKYERAAAPEVNTDGVV